MEQGGSNGAREPASAPGGAQAGIERVISRLRGWVEAESPTGDEGRINHLADLIAGELEVAGAEVERIRVPGWGQHLLARIEGREPSLEPLLLLGHFDTVHPVGTLERLPFLIEDGRITGPGIFDMKAGLAVVTEALLQLRESGRSPLRPVMVLFTCDEEVGSPTSRALIEESARGAAATLVTEPPLPGGAAKTARKGVATYTLEVGGRSAHAGVNPESGVSAIHELALQMVRIAELAEPGRGSTINLGMVSGGTASNVVPAEARVEIDLRFVTAADGDRLDNALRALEPILPGATLSLEGGINRPPLERTEGVVSLYEQARAVAEALGLDLQEGSTGGGSDGSFTAAIGVPTLDGLGVDGGGAHTEDEFILLEDLAPRVALVYGLLETL